MVGSVSVPRGVGTFQHKLENALLCSVHLQASGASRWKEDPAPLRNVHARAGHLGALCFMIDNEQFHCDDYLGCLSPPGVGIVTF